jgi:RNA-binding protein
MPATDLRRALRGHGHALSPIVQVGKAGVTTAVIKQVMQALEDHELIKVKIGGESPADRHEVADRLDDQPGVDVVQIVGRVLLLYKRHPREPRYEGKRAKTGTEARASDKRRAPGRKRTPGNKRTPGKRR